jgi:hypothetical protein
MVEAICVLDCVVHDERRFYRTQSSQLCDGLFDGTIRTDGLCRFCNVALERSASLICHACCLGRDRLRASHPLPKFLCVVVAICPVLFLLCFDRDKIPSRVRWKLITVFLLSVLLVATPWWIRNGLVLGNNLSLGTKGATTLLGGYCDESLAQGGEWQFGPEKRLREEIYSNFDFENSTSQDWIESEKIVALEASKKVKAWIYENTSSIPQLVVHRIVTEWNPYTGKSLVFKLLALVASLRCGNWIDAFCIG